MIDNMKPNQYWEDGQGVVHKISQMDDLPLFNAVCWYQRQRKSVKFLRGKICTIRNELTRRGIPYPQIEDV